jgi:CheY-like chemotaxis protein
MLPVWDGIEVIKRIYMENINPNMIKIALSGESKPEIVKMILDYDAYYFCKPFDPDLLIDRILCFHKVHSSFVQNNYDIDKQHQEIKNRVSRRKRMLNFDVKRKINALRDILVGKVPDPKAQVEQITIALIYKFMDDMDLEGMEFGASREFFKEDYEKYAWSNIMQPENSGQQRSNLYAEGIDKMSGNPHLPQLFREIFKGAYVPYRDPETLNMFLKEINDFTYDHSEELGNAFEYLLSIMGSQGGAGQFRTPRHIIDMIVEIVDPQKTDSILDPACGTAGFLISSYKHILEKIEIKTATALYPLMTEKG